MSEFVQPPAPSGGITWADYKGCLLVIEPLSFEPKVKTAFGDNDAIRANVYILKSPGESDDFEDTLIFPKILVNQTKGAIGQRIVGRLGQGQAKSNQSAPWLLEEATPEDIAKAQEWLSGRKPVVTSAQAPF